MFSLMFNIDVIIASEEPTSRFFSERGCVYYYLFPFVRVTSFQVNRPVSEHTIAHRRYVNRVYARWKPGVTAILEVAGFRPPYGVGRHDGCAGSLAFA